MSKKKSDKKEIKSKKIRKRRLTARESSLLMRASTDDATMTAEQCDVWRNADVRARIRIAVAEWAGISSSAIISSQKLKELAPPASGPWSMTQQVNLVAITNRQNPPIFHSIVPVDDQCQMKSPTSLISGETTVLEWEGIVWDNQRPGTFCGRTFGI